jgi:hypothetical protein
MPCDGDPFLWPLRPRPRPDEVFTGWIARIAQAHGLAPEVLLSYLRSRFGLETGRDLDTNPSYELISEMSRRTAVRYDRIVVMTLRWHVYPWYAHTARNQLGGSFGFCPLCWACDAVAYVRRAWRLPWMPCFEHELPLSRRCRECGWFTGTERLHSAPPLSRCGQCGFDLRHSPPAAWSKTAEPEKIAEMLVQWRAEFEEAELRYRIVNAGVCA